MKHTQSAAIGPAVDHKYSETWSHWEHTLTFQLFYPCHGDITPMDAMLTSFHSSTPAPLQNFIVYSGPPTAKNGRKRILAKGNANMQEDEGWLARASPTEDMVGQPSSSGHEACGTAIVAPGAAEAHTNVAADEYHAAEDSTTAGIDGGDLSAGCLGFPCDFSEWGGLDDNLRFQESETSIESASAHAVAPVGVLDSTAPRAATQGQARRDTPAEDRECEFTVAATDVLATDTSPGRGGCAGFSATHMTSKWPLCPSLDMVTSTERKRGEREMFCSADDDAMQITKRRKQAGSHSPQGAAEVSDGFRRSVQFESSPSKGQDEALADSPDGLGDSLTQPHCASRKHAEVDSSDDEIRPWKPRRRRRSMGSISREITDTGCPPKEPSRLSGASNGTSHQHRALVPRDPPYELQPGPPADVEGRACSPIFPENADPSTTPDMDGSPSLGGSYDDQPQTGLERPACKDIAKDDCFSWEESQHYRSKRKSQRNHNRSKALPRAVHPASVAYSYRSASPISRTPRRRVRKQIRHDASLVAASDVQGQTRMRSPPSIEDEPTWAVDKIVSSARRHGKVFYKVKWKPTWEPAESLRGTADRAVAEFHMRNAC